MSIDSTLETDETVYPDSDGEPMADNTLQWDWMVKIVSELRDVYAGQEVFVGGDLLWYPVKGNDKIRVAPDAMVVFGRPPGYRGSYIQHRENNVAPQVVFEVLSPKNTPEEMEDKRDFYERYGVEEFYIIDPYLPDVEGYRQSRGRLAPIANMNGHTSALVGVRFQLEEGDLKLFRPDGREFQTREDREQEIRDELRRIAEDLKKEHERAEVEALRADEATAAVEAERRRAEQATAAAEAERRRAEQATAAAEAERRRAEEATAAVEAERRRADEAEQKADEMRRNAEAERNKAKAEGAVTEALLAKLRALGLDPDELMKK